MIFSQKIGDTIKSFLQYQHFDYRTVKKDKDMLSKFIQARSVSQVLFLSLFFSFISLLSSFLFFSLFYLFLHPQSICQERSLSIFKTKERKRSEKEGEKDWK